MKYSQYFKNEMYGIILKDGKECTSYIYIALSLPFVVDLITPCNTTIPLSQSFEYVEWLFTVIEFCKLICD